MLLFLFCFLCAIGAMAGIMGAGMTIIFADEDEPVLSLATFIVAALIVSASIAINVGIAHHLHWGQHPVIR